MLIRGNGPIVFAIHGKDYCSSIKIESFRCTRKQLWFQWGNGQRRGLNKLSETDRERDESKVESGFGKNVSNWVGRDKVYPTNVIHMATECSNRSHSAAFPEDLPTWFIKLFTQLDDIVLDPFIGSGTTAVAAKQLRRNHIGIDTNEEYCEQARKRILQTQPLLFD